MKNKTQFLTRTALLLAIAIAFQIFGRYIPYNQFIVGPIVNAVLIIATYTAGFWSGTSVAILAPLVSAFTNKAAIAPLIIAFSPFIILGNFIIVLAFYLLHKKNRIAGVAAGAVCKFAFLYASITVFTNLVEMKPQIAEKLNGMFSWLQLLTAVIGGILALIVIKLAGKQLEKQ